MLRPRTARCSPKAAALIAPKLVDFGAQLLGERIRWLMKEMWVNVMDAGGRQAMHNHANSFVSGVVYLTPTHPGSQTVFMKSPGGTDFLLKNDHAGSDAHRVQRGQVDQPGAGARRHGAVPQLSMHAVPPNQGERRITLSFNAIPTQLDSWGYVVTAELIGGAAGVAAPRAAMRGAPLMVASGFAGLGYQIVWTQQCALWLGHESAAVLAVVAAFFGGLAVGAFALGRAHRAQRAAGALVRRRASWSSRCGACC